MPALSLEHLNPSQALIDVNELIRSASTSPPEAEQQGQEGFGGSGRALPSHPTGAGGFCPSALCASGTWEQKSDFSQSKPHLKNREVDFFHGIVAQPRLPHHGMCS